MNFNKYNKSEGRVQIELRLKKNFLNLEYYL
jgi:hypothetical protein